MSEHAPRNDRRNARRPPRPRPRRRRARVMVIVLTAVGAVALATTAIAGTGPLGFPWRPSASPTRLGFDVQSLDGGNNNRFHPTWGKANTPYTRVAQARYADGRSRPVAGPNSRYVSNRIFNDAHQNIFSEHRVSQWAFVWGQFIDHTIGLRLEPTGAGEKANIPFDANDPLETFRNDLGVIPFTRSAAAPGTGVTNPREQVNTVGSYIDASAVYSDSPERLEWLRDGPVDGRLDNNSALLLMPDDLLPTRESRDNPVDAPTVALDGHLLANPNRAMVAGDVRSNENIALTATHTLFAREHNRIVKLLPSSLTNEQKFQIARRIVIAEQQYITYTEFLPAMGVRLPRYDGYNARVNASLSNEFATVGYRAHSMIHGELEVETEADRYSPETLDALEAAGVEVETEGEDVQLLIPLNVAFFNPDLIGQIELGPLLQGIGSESEYRNDEMIDNQLRSVLFQVPVADNPDCLDGETLPECFTGVVDLGALDVERGRDHGMPSYNQLRRAYGLAPKRSFADITGERTEAFPAGLNRDNPNGLAFTRLWDVDGTPITLGSGEAETSAVVGQRRTTLAARLRAVYGSVDRLDAFTGMVAERHLRGADMGELQLAIWQRQFQALRDGDRFFYGNDPGLSAIKRAYGIDFRTSLANVIAKNTDIPADELNGNVFEVADEAEAPAPGEEADPTPTAPTGTPTSSVPDAVAANAPPGARRRG